MADSADQTVTEKFQGALAQFEAYRNDAGAFSGRKNAPEYQKELLKLIKEFRIIMIIVSHLSIFSDNETIDEMNVNYVPFLNVEYYLGTLYQNLMVNSHSVGDGVVVDGMEYKVENLQAAQEHFASYLLVLSNYGLLSKPQTERVRSYKESENPSAKDILATQERNPAAIRADKIANFKLEKELTSKIHILFSRYGTGADDAKAEFSSYDEDTTKQLYLDQVKLYALKSFSSLELIAMELEVLKKMPVRSKDPKPPRKEQPVDPTGYTTKLEPVPGKNQPISSLLSKQGKILQPFTITANKTELRNKVFGTGQVLPSMTVEEYLDYELANGKMAAEEVKNDKNDDDTDDSDVELEKRQWDDWKDDNPKGMGNTGANLG